MSAAIARDRRLPYGADRVRPNLIEAPSKIIERMAHFGAADDAAVSSREALWLERGELFDRAPRR
jgi:hypothetical protein